MSVSEISLPTPLSLPSSPVCGALRPTGSYDTSEGWRTSLVDLGTTFLKDYFGV